MEEDEEEVDLDTGYYSNYLIIDNYSRPFKNYLQTLKKIDEVDETGADENGNIRRVVWSPQIHENKKQRPKSANYVRDDAKREQTERPKSSCAGYPSRIPIHQKWTDGRPKSACSLRTGTERGLASRRSNSQPDMARPKNVWTEVNQYRRSLQLLGLSQSDFGQPASPKREQRAGRTLSANGPTFSTRVLKRSVSLDSLKEAVRQENCPRALLAQAAYEEWYFRKAEELVKKQREEREARDELSRRLETERETRREKSAEHLIRWMEGKRKQVVKKSKMAENRGLAKSKEEIDRAYVEWKKKKAVAKKKSEAVEAAKDAIAKEEKQKQAEKAFREWKTKLVEAQRVQKMKEMEAQERLRKRISEQAKPRTTFQAWKRNKDDEIRTKSKQARDIAKQAEDTRSMVVSERMYEAEQAFEDWLEKVDNRRLKDKTRSKVGCKF